VTTGAIQGQTVVLTYTWSGDTRPIDGRPGHSELTWEATLTGEEAAAWHAALAEPLLEPREIDPRSTGGSQTTLRIDHGACTRFGEPDAAWSARVGELQARAADGLPFDERVALGVASDAVIVELADAQRGLLVCGAEARSATSVAGRLRFADVPAGACTLSALSLSGKVTAYRGDRLACAAAGGRLTCSVKAPGDRPAPE
jgi:hypothetical protein